MSSWRCLKSPAALFEMGVIGGFDKLSHYSRCKKEQCFRLGVDSSRKDKTLKASTVIGLSSCVQPNRYHPDYRRRQLRRSFSSAVFDAALLRGLSSRFTWDETPLARQSGPCLHVSDNDGMEIY